MEPQCGRPLGLRRFDKENIVAVDTHLGIFMINFEKGKTFQIFSLFSY